MAPLVVAAAAAPEVATRRWPRPRTLLREGLVLLLLFAALRATLLLRRPSTLQPCGWGRCGFADLLAAWCALEVVFYRWLLRRAARMESATAPSRWKLLRWLRETAIGLLVLLLGLSLAGGPGPGRWALAGSALLGVEVMFYRWVRRRFWRFSPPAAPPPFPPEARAQEWQRCLLSMTPSPGLRRWVEGWFFGRSFTEIRREDLENWLAWALFAKASVSELREAELAELAACVGVFEGLIAEESGDAGFRLAARGAGQAPLPCMRMGVEPLRYRHFPLSMYIFTQGLLGFLTDRALRGLDFRPLQAGGLWRYWLWQPAGQRPGEPAGTCQASAEAGRPPPAFFVHGVGIGLLPYLGLVRALMQRGEAVFLLEVPFISLKIDTDVPAAVDTARAVGAILQLHGFGSAAFVGHSFGTVVLSWVWRYNPGCVAGLVLLDPVVVLLHSHHVLFNFLYRRPRGWNILDYIFSEFFLSHGLRRHLFWYESILWPEELRLASVPFLAVCAAEDEIVPARDVHRYVQRLGSEGSPASRLAPFEAVLLPGCKHGDVLVDAEAACALRRFFAALQRSASASV